MYRLLPGSSVYIKTTNLANWILSIIAVLSLIFNFFVYYNNRPVANPTIQKVALGISDKVLSDPKFLTTYFITVKIFNNGTKQVTINDFGFYIKDSTNNKYKTNAHYIQYPTLIGAGSSAKFSFKIDIFYAFPDSIKLADLNKSKHHFRYKNFDYSKWRDMISKVMGAGLIYSGIELVDKIELEVTFRYFDNKLVTRTSKFLIDRIELFDPSILQKDNS